MIRIPGGPIRLWALGGVKRARHGDARPFLIDRREVTNREFAAFVAAGGYTRRRVLEARRSSMAHGTLTFDEAMARFVDSTGRPGPATWRVGTYPDGEDDLPVGGLSWYEAAAYAAFAGKELPTVYHWYQADTANDIQLLPGLVLSTTNHDGKGPRRATATSTMSAYGAIDMAGNVREWAANASDGATRLTLGGAWTDPAYQYLFPGRAIAVRSIARQRTAGDEAARCDAAACRGHADDAPLPRNRLCSIRRTRRPVSDAEFAVFTRFFERKPVPLDARIDPTDESSPHLDQAAGLVRRRIRQTSG